MFAESKERGSFPRGVPLCHPKDTLDTSNGNYLRGPFKHVKEIGEVWINGYQFKRPFFADRSYILNHDGLKLVDQERFYSYAQETPLYHIGISMRVDPEKAMYPHVILLVPNHQLILSSQSFYYDPDLVTDHIGAEDWHQSTGSGSERVGIALPPDPTLFSTIEFQFHARSRLPH